MPPIGRPGGPGPQVELTPEQKLNALKVRRATIANGLGTDETFADLVAARVAALPGEMAAQRQAVVDRLAALDEQIAALESA